MHVLWLQATLILSDVWLGIFSGQATLNLTVFLLGYFGISVAHGIVTLFKVPPSLCSTCAGALCAPRLTTQCVHGNITPQGIIFAGGSIRASRTVHRGLLSNILDAPTRYFDKTPTGRILNRFSKDMDAVSAACSPLCECCLLSSVGLTREW